MNSLPNSPQSVPIFHCGHASAPALDLYQDDLKVVPTFRAFAWLPVVLANGNHIDDSCRFGPALPAESHELPFRSG
jgi:hypothetical protein